MMWEYGMGWGWGWLGMILFWLVPILLVLAAIKYLAGGSRLGQGAREERRKALDVLEERYARGEIDREEYLQKRDDLKRG